MFNDLEAFYVCFLSKDFLIKYDCWPNSYLKTRQDANRFSLTQEILVYKSSVYELNYRDIWYLFILA